MAGSQTKAGKALKLLTFILLGSAALLLEERWRGEIQLSLWKHNAEKRGETLDAKKLWPAPDPLGSAVSNKLAEATSRLDHQLLGFASTVDGIIVKTNGGYLRGSQQQFVHQYDHKTQTNTWISLNQLLLANRGEIEKLRELLENPPATMSYDPEACFDSNRFPNYVSIRVSAQTLHAAVLNDLHNHDLEAATKDLGTLLAFSKLYWKDPNLVNYMIRIAVLGLAVDAAWDALQSDGWSDAQLQSLQWKIHPLEDWLSEMTASAKSMEIERDRELRWFRSHNYSAWIARNEEMVLSFLPQLPKDNAGEPVRLWRGYVFHPLWRSAWADLDEVAYLEDEQKTVAALEAAQTHRCWNQLHRRLLENRRNYRRPVASWRFYLTLPLYDDFGGPKLRTEYPYADLSRAWETAMKNLTLEQLAEAAIAIKRFQLRHGEVPAGLKELTPEFLPTLPLDLMDGNALRYNRKAANDFVIYSIGSDFKDDGGNQSLETIDEKYRSPWTGKDWVWLASPSPKQHVASARSL